MVKIRHFTFVVRCGDIEDSFHNVGRTIYGKYEIGGQIQVLVLNQNNSRSGEKRKVLKLATQ